MSSKTFQHDGDVREPECPNDAISLGPEIRVIGPTSVHPGLTDPPPATRGDRLHVPPAPVFTHGFGSNTAQAEKIVRHLKFVLTWPLAYL
jgi:hypothetical protein